MPVPGNVSPSLFPLARMTVSSSGTGDITLNTNVAGFLTFDLAGCSTASAGQPLVYSINDIGSGGSEIGSGVYFSSSLLLQRGSSTFGLRTTNSNSAIVMSNAAQVYITPDAITFQRPTITALTTASGSSGTGTYTTPNNATYLRVRMVGGGGGGGSGGTTATINNGSSGSATSFGTSLLVANGGGGGLTGTAPGGTASLGSGPIGLALTGSQGTGWVANNSIGVFLGGGTGGASPFGGNGGGIPNSTGSAASQGSGSGGGGGSDNGTAVNAYALSGGGSGGYIDAIINSPLTSYSYAVGAGGAGGAAGTSGFAGGAGGSGQIIVEEHYGS